MDLYEEIVREEQQSRESTYSEVLFLLLAVVIGLLLQLLLLLPVSLSFLLLVPSWCPDSKQLKAKLKSCISASSTWSYRFVLLLLNV